MATILRDDADRAQARETLAAVVAKLEEALRLQTRIEREDADDE